MNLKDLIRLSNTYRKVKDKGSKPVSGSFKLVPQIALGRLGFEVRMKSLSGKIDKSSSRRPPWKLQFLFTGVKFSRLGEIPKNEVGKNIWQDSGVSIGKGLGNWYFKIPSIDKEDCKVMCSCPSFRHEFAFQDAAKNALVGGTSWARYSRVTPPKRRPKSPKNPNPEGRDFRNPENIPGLCHHCASMVNFLLRNNYLKR